MPKFAIPTLLLLLTFCSAHSQTFTILKSFGILTNKTGSVLRSPMVQGADGTLYGTTSEGGGIMRGAVFKIGTNGAGFALLKQFTNLLDGANPKSSLLLSGNALYGTTSAGGSEGGGTIFNINTDGSGFTVLKSLPAGSYDRNIPPPTGDSSGAYARNPPMGGLALAGNTLYGTTRSGGTAGRGTVFRVNTDGSGYSVLREFSGPDGAAPTGDLVESGGILYGTTSGGGNSNTGTVFKVSTDGNVFATLKHFTGPDGAQPYAGMVLAGATLYGTTVRGGTSSSQAGTVFKINTDGNGFALLKSFNPNGPPDGFGPVGRLALSGNWLYGTAGAILPFVPGVPTVFKIQTNGTGFTVIVGPTPPGVPLTYSHAGVVVSGDTLYGLTANTLSPSEIGDIFRVNTNGTGRTLLRRFDSNSGDASQPGSLILAGETLYGASQTGGTSNAGTVFKLDTNGGAYTILKQFNGATEGSGPGSRLAVSGNILYGAARFGGANFSGTLFKLGTNGSSFSLVRTFDAVAANPAGITLSGDTIYGTAESGGLNGNGVVYQINTNGSGFVLLKDFNDGPGAAPWGEPLLAGDTLYGVTTYGGAFGYGNVYKVNTNGTGFTVLHSFGDGDQIRSASTRLTLANDTLYGIGYSGTNAAGGTIYKVNTDGNEFGIVAQLSDPRLGAYPLSPSGLLISGSTIYGATRRAVFQINTNGTGFAIVKAFGSLPDGDLVNGDLILVGTTLYGTTAAGGELGEGTVFRLDFRPRLEIVRGLTNVTLSWPSYAMAYALEQNSDLNMTTWAPVGTASVDDGTNRVVTLAATNPFTAYRLRY